MVTIYVKRRPYTVDLLAPRVWRVTHVNSNYEVSDCGQVRNRTTGRMLRLSLSGQVGRRGYTGKRSYFQVGLSDPSWTIARTTQVHKLVCWAFNGPPPSLKHEVAHNNGDKRDNRADNLRWATHAENEADKKLHGTYKNTLLVLIGENHPRAKLTEDGVREIRRLYAVGDYTQQKISEIIGIHPHVVNDVICQRTWKHVT